jgi:hypothetical protein
MVRSVLQVHNDEMQARSKPLTAPDFVRGDKVNVVTKHLFLRGRPNKEPRDRQLGPFLVKEQIGKHIYILKLLAIVHLIPVFMFTIYDHAPQLSLRPAVPVTVPEGDDKEFEVSHI